MGALKDKILGIFNIGAGRVKRGMAYDLADKKLEGKGSTQELKGKAQKTLGDLKGAAGNAVQKVGSKIKKAG